MTTPARRRSDRPETVHARARAAAAARLDGRIDPRVNAWLDAHLGDCADCAAIADAYAGQQAELRALRDRLPQPPRDLWARTSAAIEREASHSARHDAAFNRNGAIRSRRRIAAPLGALSGLLVVAVVLGATVLSNRPLPAVVATASAPVVAAAASPSLTRIPGATPFAVAAANVGWVRLGAAGHADVFDSTVSRVCPGHQGAECPPIDEPSSKSITLPDQPSSVIKSPNDRQLVVVDSSTKGAGGQVYVVADPEASASPSPSPSATTAPTSPPVTASARPTPSATPTPLPASPSVKPTPVDSPTPTRTPTPSITASVTLPPPSPTPSAAASPSPSASPGTRAIARDVIIVGQAAAYSPDGTWFAFSARPADRSHGPDIYVWHVGADKATPITTDHRSVFATWLGKHVLGSRGVADPAQPAGSQTLRPEAFLLDPTNGKELGLAGGHVWRPSVDPQRRLAVYWDGTLALNDAGTDLAPDTGNLVLGPWNDTVVTVRPGKPAPSPASSPTASVAPAATAPARSVPGSSGGPTSAPSAKPSPRATATPVATTSPKATGTPVATDAALASTTLATGRVTDWDARWDETGTHLAVWIADPNDPKSGKLTLYVVDPASGTLHADRPVHDVRAQAGFSIGKGRLAWATPPGQDGRGSRIQVLAWTDDSVGSVETQQSEDDVVVIR
ncbi:MAG TPA: hypothetical protein VGC90_05675 [Candidatus Limnocylindrales bacterium]